MPKVDGGISGRLEDLADRSESRLASWFLLAGGLVVILPYVVSPVVPGLDYANHLARLYVLGAGTDGPILRSFVPHWAVMPDLGVDLIYAVLGGLLSPEVVLRLCLAGSLSLMLYACWRIQALLFGRATFAMALAPLFVAGLPVFMGYINFIIGCASLMVGFWIYIAGNGLVSNRRLSALCALACLTWFSHIAAYAALVVLVGGAQRWRPSVWPAAKIIGAVAAPGLILSALAEKGSETQGLYYEYGATKFRLLLAPLLAVPGGGDLVIWAGVVAVCAVAVFFGRWSVARAVRPGILVLGTLVLLLPWRLNAAIDVDSRLAVPLMLALLSGSDIRLPGNRSGMRVGVAWLAILVLLRSFNVAGMAAEQARAVTAFRVADRLLPENGTLMVASDRRRLADCSRAAADLPASTIGMHLAAYATIDRGIFEPFIFAAPGLQPIRAAKAPFMRQAIILAPPSLDQLLAAGTAESKHDDANPFPVGWPGDYDALLLLGQGCTANPLPKLLEPLSAGPGFILFRVPASGDSAKSK